MRRRRRDVSALELAPGTTHAARHDTTAGLFILDALDPMTEEALDGAADDLVGHLTRLGPDVRIARRLIATDTNPDEGA